LRKRGELLERSFAHCYETGGLRRTHLRKHANIVKRQLIHVGAFNLGLVMRRLLGAGMPRELGNRLRTAFLLLYWLILGSWGSIEHLDAAPRVSARRVHPGALTESTAVYSKIEGFHHGLLGRS